MARRFLIALAALWATAFPAPAAETKPRPRIALVIGNARYEPAVGPLRNSVNDAKAVAKTLRGLDFTVIEEHDVSRNDLLGAVAKFRAKLPNTEVALFYYAGHGISVGGSNYLIPVRSGYNPERADAATLRMLAETKLFNAEQVVAEMSAAGGRCNLVILDACRSTPVARDPGSRDAATRGGLTEMNPPAGSLIAFATDAGRVARDGDGKNGLYTEELLKNLGTPGLTIEQVFKRTRAGVMERSGGTQIPAEYSRLVGEDVYLAGSTPPPPPPPPRAEPVSVPGAEAIKRLAGSGDAAACADALFLTAATRGPGSYAVAPLETILDKVKEDLKDATGPSPKVEPSLRACDAALAIVARCLPPGHPQAATLTAKARNRRGDCLLLLGKPGDALADYNAAIELAPDDAYPLYNRGRAHLALGRKDEAAADFTAAASDRFKQAGARRLAQQALRELQGAAAD